MDLKLTKRKIKKVRKNLKKITKLFKSGKITEISFGVRLDRNIKILSDIITGGNSYGS